MQDPTILSDKPLIICDVDEVVLHFVQALEDYLAGKDLRLLARSYALSGNIVDRQDVPVSGADVGALIKDFHARHMHLQSEVDHAAATLLALSRTAQIVMLTNIADHLHAQRQAQLVAIGVPYPVITHSGPKGETVRMLAARTGQPSFFIDDSALNLSSAAEHAPDVHLIQMIADPRYLALSPEVDGLALKTGSWREIGPFIDTLLPRT